TTIGDADFPTDVTPSPVAVPYDSGLMGGILIDGSAGGTIHLEMRLGRGDVNKMDSTATLETPGDADADGIPDTLDKCVLDSRNVVATCDTDQDGYGNPCDPDFDQNFAVNAVDFGSYFIPAFKGFVAGTRGQDMDCNGAVGANDFGS